jgi:isoquinoline 1-oxidoreductase beta subunit
MEPLNITARFDGDRAEAWTTSQLPTTEQQAMADVLGLPAQQVKFHIGYGGGAFGRRGTLDAHLEVEVAAIVKRMRGVPVKLIWTREDDVQGGYYRPLCAHRVELGIADDGTPAAWRHVVVGQSFIIGTGTPFESMLVKNGVDALVVEGTVDCRYVIPNFHVSAHHPNVNVHVYSLRSVGMTHNTFVVETLIDELAMRAKADPIAYRLQLIDADAKRHRAARSLLRQDFTACENPYCYAGVLFQEPDEQLQPRLIVNEYADVGVSYMVGFSIDTTTTSSSVAGMYNNRSRCSRR